MYVYIYVDSEKNSWSFC